MLNRQNVEAFYAMKNSLKYLDVSDAQKATEMKDQLRILNQSVATYEFVERCLSNSMKDKDISNCKMLCEDIKNFQKQNGEVLLAKVLWCEGNTKESIKILKNSAKYSSSRLNSYFQLLEYLKEIEDYQSMKTIGKEMIVKCKNNQIPTFV